MACNLKETFPGARFWQLLAAVVGQEEFVFKRPLSCPHTALLHTILLGHEEILEISESKQVLKVNTYVCVIFCLEGYNMEYTGLVEATGRTG